MGKSGGDVKAFTRGFKHCNSSIDTWASYFSSLENVITTWWKALHGLPTDDDMKRVSSGLDAAAASCIALLPPATPRAAPPAPLVSEPVSRKRSLIPPSFTGAYMTICTPRC